MKPLWPWISKPELGAKGTKKDTKQKKNPIPHTLKPYQRTYQKSQKTKKKKKLKE